MNSIHYILLLAVERMQGERTINGIVHLLNGKRSSQTIQDISLFRCEQLAAILKSSLKSDKNKAILYLLKNNLITEDSNSLVNLTSDGVYAFEQLSKIYTIPKTYQGLKYEWDESATKFWQQLSLLVQSISCLLEKQFRFIPVTYNRDCQTNIKQQLTAVENIHQFGQQLYLELATVLEKRSETEADFFVKRLTSSIRTGRTMMQLASTFHEDQLYASINFRSIVHEMMERSFESKALFPILAAQLRSNVNGMLVTKTAMKTKRCLEDGYSLGQISTVRTLKASTIEDHIIELSIYDPGFDLSLFIEDDDVEQIKDVARLLNTKRLKQIKNYMGERYTYFQIRLALSTYKGEDPLE